MDPTELTNDRSNSSRLARRLLAVGALMLVLSGALLWMREGEKLFTEGLIATLAGCF